MLPVKSSDPELMLVEIPPRLEARNLTPKISDQDHQSISLIQPFNPKTHINENFNGAADKGT
jgi:hypothetical protein